MEKLYDAIYSRIQVGVSELEREYIKAKDFRRSDILLAVNKERLKILNEIKALMK